MNTIESLPSEALVGTLEALQTVADGQRHRVLSLLIDEPLTARELAERLKIARTRLYYHLDLLEKHGFIRVTETRVVSGIPERTYRAVARAFRVDRALLSAQTSGTQVADAQASILEAVAGDLRSQPPSATDEVLVARVFLRLDERGRHELRDRLSALVAEYGEDSQREGIETEIALAVFPTGQS